MPKWIAHLVNLAINGASTGVLASAGTSLAGVSLNFKQLLTVAASGALIATLRHLQQSPLIPENGKEN